MFAEVFVRSLAALLLTAAGGIGLAVCHRYRLTGRVASHFDGSGAANGWTTRDANFLMAVGLILGMTAMFLFFATLMHRLPAKWINLPHRAYWLDGERGDQTRRHLRSWSFGFGALVNVFLVYVQHLVYLANRSDPPALNTIALYTGLGLFLLVAIGGVIALVIRYRKID